MSVGSVRSVKDSVSVGSVGEVRDSESGRSVGGVRDGVSDGSVGGVRDSVSVESVGSVRVSVSVGNVRRIERDNAREAAGVVGLWRKNKGKVMRGEYVIGEVRVEVSFGFIYIRLQIIELDFIVIKQV